MQVPLQHAQGELKPAGRTSLASVAASSASTARAPVAWQRVWWPGRMESRARAMMRKIPFGSSSRAHGSVAGNKAAPTCAICLEPLLEPMPAGSSSEQPEPCSSSNDVCVLGCQHAFHTLCIWSWREESDQCPCCRQPFSLNETAAEQHSRRVKSAPPAAFDGSSASSLRRGIVSFRQHLQPTAVSLRRIHQQMQPPQASSLRHIGHLPPTASMRSFRAQGERIVHHFARAQSAANTATSLRRLQEQRPHRAAPLGPRNR